MESLESLKGDGAAEEGQWFVGMSWTTRIQAFLMFTALSMFSSFMGWVALGMGYMWKYSVLTTLGELMSICSTLVLMGPRAQLKNMFDEKRKIATIVYLSTMVLTACVAILTRSIVLCALCGIVQYAALAWYSLSYIPYGREMVTACLLRCLKISMNQ
jgi:hypothetical protein